MGLMRPSSKSLSLSGMMMTLRTDITCPRCGRVTFQIPCDACEQIASGKGKVNFECVKMTTDQRLDKLEADMRKCLERLGYV